MGVGGRGGRALLPEATETVAVQAASRTAVARAAEGVGGGAGGSCLGGVPCPCRCPPASTCFSNSCTSLNRPGVRVPPRLRLVPLLAVAAAERAATETEAVRWWWNWGWETADGLWVGVGGWLLVAAPALRFMRASRRSAALALSSRCLRRWAAVRRLQQCARSTQVHAGGWNVFVSVCHSLGMPCCMHAQTHAVSVLAASMHQG